jgi:tetratricopeptide (TPR) repeat protein
MFDDDDHEGYDDSELRDDLKRFEKHLKGESIGFLDSDRWEALIDHFLISGKYSKALLCAEEALSQFSYNTILQLRKAQAHSAIGELKEALHILNTLERAGHGGMEVLLTKASVFSQLKDSKNAIRYFKESLVHAEPADRDEIYLDLAMEYQNAGEMQRAINVLREAIAENPSNEGAIYELAYCYDQNGDFASSIKCYSDFIEDNPYSFTAWYNLGNAYAKSDQLEKAAWAYDYCILINDSFGPAYFNLAHTYLSLDRYTAAISNFEKCMTLDGDDPLALSYIGECYEQLGELTKAKTYYQKSLELAPMLPDAWLGLGIVEDLEGKTREAIVLIQKAADLDPENASVFHVLAGAYEKLGDRENALQNYHLALELEPSDTNCLRNYVQLRSEDSHQSALEFLEEFEADHDNDISEVLKVSLLWRLGRASEALNLFKKCLVTDREMALELFDFHPALKNVQEFVLLSDQ